MRRIEAQRGEHRGVQIRHLVTVIDLTAACRVGLAYDNSAAQPATGLMA